MPVIGDEDASLAKDLLEDDASGGRLLAADADGHVERRLESCQAAGGAGGGAW